MGSRLGPEVAFRYGYDGFIGTVRVGTTPPTTPSLTTNIVHNEGTRGTHPTRMALETILY